MPDKGPFAESCCSRFVTAVRRFFLRFISPEKHSAALVLRQAASVLASFPSSASRERLAKAEARAYTIAQSALSGKVRLSRGSPLRHAEEVFVCARALAGAASGVRRNKGRFWPVITDTVRGGASIVRALERHLCAGRKGREASRRRLEEALERARRELVSARLHAHAVSGTDDRNHDLLEFFLRAEELVDILENRPRRRPAGDAAPQTQGATRRGAR